MIGITLEDSPRVVVLLSVLLSLIGSGHAVLNKRDSRAATGWVGVIWLVPLLGCLLYFLLGINRVKRLAKIVRDESLALPIVQSPFAIKDGDLEQDSSKNYSLVSLARLGTSVTKRPILKGNQILPLSNGDAAYPQMLSAIEQSKRSILLSTYIFDYDEVGKQFLQALTQAVARGVHVRVLIDDIGLRYSWLSVVRRLKKNNVPVARFMGALRPRTFPHLNLRKHRKLLLCDGLVAFTGGMNIRSGHVLGNNPKHPVQDLHFKVQGPLVAQLQEVFIEDWAFTTKEILRQPHWAVQAHESGQAKARVISDGPDEDLNKLPIILEGAISAAQKSIWILTPYFLPDASLSTALCVAAGKGIDVNIVLPQKNNLPFVQWASNPLLVPLLQYGCSVWFTAPPFDHAKLMLVDESWALFGSANWDPRSLRLNFELNVEAYDEDLGLVLKSIITEKLTSARKVKKEELCDRGLPMRLRDGVARLFSPYL